MAQDGQDPKLAAVVTLLRSIGQADPSALKGIVERTRRRPDAIDRLGEFLREDGRVSRLLMVRILETIRDESSLAELVTDLETWRVAPYVDALFRLPSSGGRPGKGVLAQSKDRQDAAMVDEIRRVLLKWEPLCPPGAREEEIRSFLMKEWVARRFPFTREEVAEELGVSPDSLDGSRSSLASKLRPFIAHAIFVMGRKRDRASAAGDMRKTDIRPKRWAAQVWLSATSRPATGADVTRLLKRLEKRSTPK